MLKSSRVRGLQERAFEQIIRNFGEIVVKDMGIQLKLNEAIDSGMSRDDWINLYVELAQSNGFDFTPEQMKIAIQEQKQGKDKVLPSIVQKWVTVL